MRRRDEVGLGFVTLAERGDDLTVARVLRSSSWQGAVLRSAIVTVLFVIIASCLVFPPAFATMDDIRLLYVYAGYANGAPTGTYVFNNAILGNVIATLYRLVPGFSWYYALHLICIAVVDLILGIAIHVSLKNSRRSMLLAVLIHVIAMICVSLDALSLIHFEVTASIAASGAILTLLMCNDESDGSWLSYVVSLFLMMVAYMTNKNASYPALALIVILVGLDFVMRLKGGGGVRIRSLVFVAVLVCMLLGLKTADKLLHDDAWANYNAMNSYRVVYSDYPHTTYDENPELFASMGWSKEFFELVDKRYYIDSRYSLESLKQLVHPFSRMESPTGPFDAVRAFGVFASLCETNAAARVQLSFGLLLCLLCLYVFAQRHDDAYVRRIFVMVVLSVIVGAVLVVYLSWRGRLPLRAWEAVSIPVLSVILWGSCGLFGHACSLHDPKQLVVEGSNARIGTFYLAAIFVLLVLMQEFGCYTVDAHELLDKRRTLSEEMHRVEAFALTRPEDFFVHGTVIQNYDPLSSFAPDRKPTNLMLWGTSYTLTPVGEEQFRANGHERITSETFAQEHVYYLHYGDANTLEEDIFVAMLRNDYGYDIASAEYVDDCHVTVVKFAASVQ